ncbi:MAG: hypothetical protein QOF31_3206 [Mycobacterium sp.]|jgi:hypothetical protein|nr:hypothetical protein [Mycobacterium sp.]
MSPDPTAQIAALRIEPTYSAREAAVLLGPSYSWLDQRVRGGQFTNPDGSVLQPLRTPGGYRRFRQSTLRDIALCCYRHRWFTMNALKLVLRELATAAMATPTGRPGHRDHQKAVAAQRPAAECSAHAEDRQWAGHNISFPRRDHDNAPHRRGGEEEPHPSRSRSWRAAMH